MKPSAEFEAWLQQAANGSAEGIKGSAAFAALLTKNFLEDPLCALQIGLAILMDKPIVLLVAKGEKIPETLRSVAALIETVDMNNPVDMHHAQASLMNFIKKMSDSQVVN